jgi:cerevisin
MTCIAGHNILSTWISNNTAANIISGSSSAAAHTAGLLAYLLSIYPSKEFDAVFEETDISFSRAPQTLASVYEMLYNSLPGWVSGFLLAPPVLGEAVESLRAPPVLTPARLKAALLSLATKDALLNIPPNSGTPNLLLFNNATKDN